MNASELAARLGGTLEGEDVEITACAGLEEARKGDLSFCKDVKHVKLVQSTKASAVLLPPDWTDGAPCAIIRVADPNHACMAAAALFAPPTPERAPGVHPTAIVDPSVKLGEGVHVGAYTIIEKGTVVGDGAVIEAQVFIGENCVVGAGSHLYPQVTLREGTKLGRGVILHCGVRLGGDGYGYNTTMEGGIPKIEKIPQLGIVELADFVEIGSNTTIDRARIGRTYIGPHTKIDNLVQIGHNVKVAGYSGIIAQAGVAGSTQIGSGCLIWAQAGISGSSILGNGVILAGQAGLAGHLRIGDGAIVMAQAGISKDIAPGKIMFGTPAVERRDFAKQMLNISRIEKLNDTVKNLVKQVAELQDALAKANGKEEN